MTRYSYQVEYYKDGFWTEKGNPTGELKTAEKRARLLKDVGYKVRIRRDTTDSDYT